MHFNKIKKAFTLIELLVGMSILTIIILWTTSIDYNRINNKQQLEFFTYSIKTNFETIRNSTLAWKWIWVNLDIPEKWKIEYSKTNSWMIQSSSYNGSTWEIQENLFFKPGFSISKIYCLDINWDNSWEIFTWTWIIEFEWINIKLNTDSICDSDTSKILELVMKYKYDTKNIQINTLNWLIEIK